MTGSDPTMRLAQPRSEKVEDEADLHLAAKRYIRDWVPDHVRDYVASLERPDPKPAGDVAAIRAAALEEAAAFIDKHELLHTSDGDLCRPRTDGNRAGLGFAAGIRSLAASPAPANAAPASESEGA